MSSDDAVLLAMLARTAEAKGADREQAIALAQSALRSRTGMRRTAEETLAMFDEVEAAAVRG